MIFSTREKTLIAAYRDLKHMPQWTHIGRDLATFCRANDTTFAVDPITSANLQGRREVWLHIQRMSGLNDDDLMQVLLNQLESARNK